ncbi:MAG: ribonuclease III [Atopobiaceae bacterium]|nr:ribonuclease III [Atopobiaceae bacterium]
MSATAVVRKVEKICDHHFSHRELIESALTHPSAVEGRRGLASYERLEFLGDSILGAMVATDLYELHPTLDEGELTKLKISLVSGENLSRVAQELGLSELIIFGESERGTGARGMHSALENVYEALVGALYLDAGYKKAHEFVRLSLKPDSELVPSFVPDNPKSLLQEYTQRELHCAPEYKIVGNEGPAHDPVFTAVVLVQGVRVGRGSGSSKKLAESLAAQQALEFYTAANSTAPERSASDAHSAHNQGDAGAHTVKSSTATSER